jgi:hypothetical protein
MSAGLAPARNLRFVIDADPVPDPEDIMTVFTIIGLYEDDEVCDSAILVVETGFDRTEVGVVLDYLWREDRIECRLMRAGNEEMLTGIRRVLPGRERRWGKWGHYVAH